MRRTGRVRGPRGLRGLTGASRREGAAGQHAETASEPPPSPPQSCGASGGHRHPPPMAAQVPKPTPSRNLLPAERAREDGASEPHAYEKYNKKNWMRQTGSSGAEQAAGESRGIPGRQGLRVHRGRAPWGPDCALRARAGSALRPYPTPDSDPCR